MTGETAMAHTHRADRQRAVQLASEGKLEEALAEYQGVLKDAPDDAEVRQKVAELLEWLSRPADAAAAYEEAALAWAKAGQLLRAVAACVAVPRLEAPHAALVRTARVLAERFALPPGAPLPAAGHGEPRPGPGRPAGLLGRASDLFGAGPPSNFSIMVSSRRRSW